MFLGGSRLTRFMESVENVTAGIPAPIVEEAAEPVAAEPPAIEEPRRHPSCSCDTVGPPMRRLRRILHPSDFSPASRAAFRTALEAAKAQRSELIIAHVVQAPMAAGLPAKMRDQVRSLAWEEAEKKLERLVRSARSAGVRATSLILGGRAAHESIVVAARRRRADLIVISTHGRTGLPAMLLGSVASRVIATAPCPVLTVRR